jgi:DNA-binding MarR family transcriptional regulator
MPGARDLTLDEYRALAELRYHVRRFLRFSEGQARAADVEPQQHQLLLVLKALRPPERPTIRTIAERLQIRHNSAVELAQRSVECGLVERRSGERDRREALLRLTRSGERLLRRLSLAHRDELRSGAPALASVLEALVGRRPAKEKKKR